MKAKSYMGAPRGLVSSHIDDQDVLAEDEFYTTHSGRNVRRRRSTEEKTSGDYMFLP